MGYETDPQNVDLVVFRGMSNFLQNSIMRLPKFMPILCLLFLLAPAALKAQKVLVTKNGTKYHMQDCRYATGASASDVKDALDKKLVPCEVCKPPAKPNGEGTQCKGKTKSGARCNRMTLAKNGMCWQHG